MSLLAPSFFFNLCVEFIFVVIGVPEEGDNEEVVVVVVERVVVVLEISFGEI
jgi:hypothetical protein